VNRFEELRAADLTPQALKSQMGSKGYVLIRELIPRDAIEAILSDVANVLSAAGWLRPNASPLQRKPADGASFGDPDPAFKRVYQNVFNLESFHALPHHPALRLPMEMLVGSQILVHPKPIGRLIFPNCERLVVHAHQDYEFMKGDPEFYTIWIPLHDCTQLEGPLAILEGSHRFGIQEHQRDNLHVPEIPMDTALGDGWVSGQVNAGDVLMFHGLTIHAATPNSSDRMRLSLDCRFQDAKRAVHPSNLVFSGESNKSWEKTYQHWQSDQFQYYWRRLPLTVKPSRAELEELANSQESAPVRARYARMASQLG
jgi:ectoine hydroxylase-related dioxygenase (phytanoyl-CoA dioxygenase family)